MLFSHPGLAPYLSAQFECAWQSLRPVPQVSIDFGDGRVLRRTLSGNVATWFCTPDGRALDVVPGLIDVAGLGQRAAEALALHQRVSRADDPAAALRAHHAQRALAAPVELPLPAPAGSMEDPLASEARTNANVRGPLARALLARATLCTPEQLTKELFRDVLDVDLADPYLGLAPYVLGGEGGRDAPPELAAAFSR